jgi:hypothetical protein
VKATRQHPLPLHRLRLIAALAGADPRTVERRLLGQPVRGLQGERIDAALARLNATPAAGSVPVDARDVGALADCLGVGREH